MGKTGPNENYDRDAYNNCDWTGENNCTWVTVNDGRDSDSDNVCNCSDSDGNIWPNPNMPEGDEPLSIVDIAEDNVCNTPDRDSDGLQEWLKGLPAGDEPLLIVPNPDQDCDSDSDCVNPE